MKTLEINEQERPSLKGQNLIQLPYGLLGFEAVKNYILLARPQEDPFLWMQMMDGPKKSFLIVSPFLAMPDYQPDLSETDVEFLGLTLPSDALLLNICTVRPNETPTINLKGPIVINRHTMIAKQCIPENAAQYSLRHPLPTT